jgi:hypothetical protein
MRVEMLVNSELGVKLFPNGQIKPTPDWRGFVIGVPFTPVELKSAVR